SGTNSGTLNLNGASVTVNSTDATASAVAVNSGVTLATNGTLTINMNGAGTMVNNGTLQSSAGFGASPTILVQNTGGSFTLDGSGAVSQTNASPGLTEFISTGTLTLTSG